MKVLGEDNKGQIWDGSFRGNLSVISGSSIRNLPNLRCRWMMGAASFRDKTILYGEKPQGITSFESGGKRTAFLSDSATMLSTFVSRNGQRIYSGAFRKPVNL